MGEKEDKGYKNELLETVLQVIHSQNNQNVNELVSLLALSNLLGIISFLNTQDLKFDTKSNNPGEGMSDLKEMAASLLTSAGGGKKINPAALINLMKTLSEADNSKNDKRDSNKQIDNKKG